MSEQRMAFQCLNNPEYEVVFRPGEGVEADVICCVDGSMCYNFAVLNEQGKVGKLLQCLRGDSQQVDLPARNSFDRTVVATLNFRWISSKRELAIKTLHPINDWMEFDITLGQAYNLADQIILSNARNTPLPTPTFGLDYASFTGRQ